MTSRKYQLQTSTPDGWFRIADFRFRIWEMEPLINLRDTLRPLRLKNHKIIKICKLSIKPQSCIELCSKPHGTPPCSTLWLKNRQRWDLPSINLASTPKSATTQAHDRQVWDWGNWDLCVWVCVDVWIWGFGESGNWVIGESGNWGIEGIPVHPSPVHPSPATSSPVYRTIGFVESCNWVIGELGVSVSVCVCVKCHQLTSQPVHPSPVHPSLPDRYFTYFLKLVFLSLSPDYIALALP